MNTATQTIELKRGQRAGANALQPGYFARRDVWDWLFAVLVLIVPRVSSVSGPPVDVTATAVDVRERTGWPIVQPVGHVVDDLARCAGSGPAPPAAARPG